MASTRFTGLVLTVLLLQCFSAVGLGISRRETQEQVENRANSTRLGISLPIPGVTPYQAPDGLLYFFEGKYDPSSPELHNDIADELEAVLRTDIASKPRSVRTIPGSVLRAYSSDGRSLVSLLWVMAGGQPLTYGQCLDALSYLSQQYSRDTQYRHNSEISVLVNQQTKFTVKISYAPPGEPIDIRLPGDFYLEGDFFVQRRLPRASVQGVLDGAKMFFADPQRAHEPVQKELMVQKVIGNVKLEIGTLYDSVETDITNGELAAAVDHLWVWLMHRGAFGAVYTFWGRAEPGAELDVDVGIIAITEVSLDSAPGSIGNLTGVNGGDVAAA